jgi:hypothetical protein
MITLSPEQDQYLQLAQTRAYYDGVRQGIEMYAHWRDGEQYVGTTGRTLKEALERVSLAEADLLSRFDRMKVL